MKGRFLMKKPVLKSIFFSVILLLLQKSIVYPQDLQSAIKLTRSEQFCKADQIFKSVLEKNPGDGSIYFYYGENYLQKYFSDTLTYAYNEMADSAKTLFLMGTVKAPDNPLNYVGLGEIELIMKDTIEAQKHFDKVLSLLPSKKNKNSTISKKEHAIVLIKSKPPGVSIFFLRTQRSIFARAKVCAVD